MRRLILSSLIAVAALGVAQAAPEIFTVASRLVTYFERCHPGETLEDIKRRVSFSKEDKGLLRDWMAIAALRAAADRIETAFAVAAE